MNRKTLRWLIFSLLLAGVAALSIYNNLSNARMLRALLSPDASIRADAFADLVDRQDAYNLVQSLREDDRRQIARRLADWHEPDAVRLAVTLVRDPVLEVRQQLIHTLASLAERFPAQVAAQMTTSNATQRSALLEAASAATTGEEIATLAFRDPASRENASALFVRMGARSSEGLLELLRSGDTATALAAADTLVRIGAAAERRDEIADAILQLYLDQEDQAHRDALIPAVAEFPVEPTVFEQILDDPIAPPYLQAAAVRGLANLGRYDKVRQALDSVFEEVAEAAAQALGL